MENAGKTTKKAMKFLLRHSVKFLVFLVLYAALNLIFFGVYPVRYQLPDRERVAQIEVQSADLSVPSKILTSESDILLTYALLNVECEYTLLNLGPEDLPGLFLTMTLDDGSTYQVAVGDDTVSFHGQVRNLKRETGMAVDVLTRELLSE